MPDEHEAVAVTLAAAATVAITIVAEPPDATIARVTGRGGATGPALGAAATIGRHDTAVAPGRHVFEVRRDGYLTERVEIDAVAGRGHVERVRLRPLPPRSTLVRWAARTRWRRARCSPSTSRARGDDAAGGRWGGAGRARRRRARRGAVLGVMALRDVTGPPRRRPRSRQAARAPADGLIVVGAAAVVGRGGSCARDRRRSRSRAGRRRGDEARGAPTRRRPRRAVTGRRARGATAERGRRSGQAGRRGARALVGALADRLRLPAPGGAGRDRGDGGRRRRRRRRPGRGPDVRDVDGGASRARRLRPAGARADARARRRVWTFDTNSGALTDPDADASFPTSALLTPAGGPEVRVVSVASFALATGAELRVRGRRPLVVAAWSVAELDGHPRRDQPARRAGGRRRPDACATAAARPGADHVEGGGGGGGGGAAHRRAGRHRQRWRGRGRRGWRRGGASDHAARGCPARPAATRWLAAAAPAAARWWRRPATSSSSAA
ncbi:MAG: hypothetical protein HS111_07165 [Kofleriaceae bacterium]|nr:hypothetical protein [Kofleriaceae bacterium]